MHVARAMSTGAQLQPRILNGIPTFALAHQQASRGVMRPHPGARRFGRLGRSEAQALFKPQLFIHYYLIENEFFIVQLDTSRS